MFTMTRAKRWGKIAVGIAAALSLLLAIGAAALWVRSCRVADVWWRQTTWDSISNGQTVYHQRSLILTSGNGAIRFQVGSSRTLRLLRPYRPRRLTGTGRARRANQRSFFYPFPGPPPFGQRTVRAGWNREKPDNEYLQRSRTTTNRLLGFYWLGPSQESIPGEEEWHLVGFPHWTLVVIFLLLPGQLAIGRRRRPSESGEVHVDTPKEQAS